MGETGKEAEKRMEDEKIIALFFARSEQAIQELDKKYGQRCHTVSYNILNNRQDAEECVNDAYFGAWKAMPPAKPNPLLTYLLKSCGTFPSNAIGRKEQRKETATIPLPCRRLRPVSQRQTP